MQGTPNSVAPKPFQLDEPRQQVIFERLYRLVGPGAADFYKDACQQMFALGQQIPASSLTHIVGHSIREVESSLRDVLEPFKVGKQKPAEKCADCQQTVDPLAIKCTNCNQFVPPPREGHKKEIRSILKGLNIGEEEEIAKAWLDISGELHKLTHREGLKALRKPDAGFIDFWNKSEIVIYGVLDKFEAEYSKVFSAVDRIAKINNPQATDADYLYSNIPHNHITYEHLFSKLNDSRWLPLLNNKGFFTELPPPEYGEHDGSPTVRYPQWPATIYLQKMATVDAETVSQILLKIPETNNLNVKNSLLEVAALLPTEKHILLAEQIRKWTHADSHQFLSDATVTILKKLVDEKQVNLAFDIAVNLLEIIPDPRSKSSPEDYVFRHDPITRLGDWQYKEFLEGSFQDLVKADAQKSFSLVCEQLKKFVEYKYADRESAKTHEDYMHISRPAIEDHVQNHLYDRTENSLVNSVRDIALNMIKQDPNALVTIVGQLESYKWNIFLRIAIYLVAQNPSIDAVITTKYLINPRFFGSSSVKHEYTQLLDKGFGLLKPKEKKSIFKKIESRESIRDFLDKPDAFSSEEIKNRYQENWEHEQLFFIKKHLSGKWKKRFNDLSKTYKDPAYPGFSSYMATAHGPKSAVTAITLSEMDTDSVIELLRTWEPKKDDSLIGPSKDGLGRELIAAIKSKPELFAGLACRLKGLDPTYIRSYLQAFHELIQVNQDVVWEEVLSLCEWVLEQPIKIPGRTGNHFDQDPDWDWTRKAIASFVSRGLNENKIPLSLRERIWKIIEQLTHDANPTPEEELDKSGKPIFDAYSLSVNTTRGDAIGGVAEYALWVLRDGEKAEDGIEDNPGGFVKMPEVQEVLEKHLDSKRDPSIAVRAVYGRFFPWILLLDKEWTLKNTEKIFPKDNFKDSLYQAAWNTYISYVPAYNEPFKVLKAEYLLATKHFGTNPKDENQRLDPEQRLAEHIMIFYGRDLIKLDDEIMVSFWENAPIHIRSHALDFIGRGLIQSDIDLSEVHMGRLKALWEKRRTLAESSVNKEEYRGEMSAFGWWFSSNNLDPVWASEEYLKALNIGNDIHSDHYVTKRLVKIAESLPSVALRVLDKLIQVQPQGWLVFGNKEEIKKVLSIALNAPETSAVKAAKDIIGRLLSRGYSDFSDLLEETVHND